MNAPTPTTTATPTLQERAAAALEDSKRETAIREAEEHQADMENRNIRLAVAIENALPDYANSVTPSCGRAEIDGLVFGVKGREWVTDRYSRHALFLIRPCHICGQEAWDCVYSLTGLGSLLEQTPQCTDTDRHAEVRAAERVTCPTCRGDGRILENLYGSSNEAQCYECFGTGTVPAHAQEAQDVQQPTALERLGQALLDVLAEQGYISAHQE